MSISARVVNSKKAHSVLLRTNDREQPLHIRPKADGCGSSINGGELLFLALATCFCNDIYREAKKRDIEVFAVEVEVMGEFGAEGASAQGVRYRVNLTSNALEDELADLVRYTDTVAEIHNTLRSGVDVNLKGYSRNLP